MPNTLVDGLLKAISPGPESQSASALSNLNFAGDALRQLTTQLEALRGVYQSQTALTSENTAAVAQNTRFRAGETVSSAATIAGTAGSVIGGSFPLVPVISAIAKLFGFGASKQDLPALTPFSLPTSIDLEGGVSRGGASSVEGISYGQDSLPRAASQPSPRGQTNISVNVQAIDSRSFLDHSDEIARAVREAMLSSHPLNDVIAEV